MKRLLFAVTFGALAWAAACGGSPTGPSGSGTLRVMLRDSPYSDARSLLVTISEVSVHRAGNTADGEDDDDGEWITIPLEGGSGVMCDLKKLETTERTLGAGSLEPGHYTQVRLHVSAASLFFDNAAGGNACAPSIDPPSGRSAPLVIPSGVIKLNRGFDIPEGESVTMLLDFDGDRSVHQTGNGRYMMSPVIGVISVK